MTLALIGNECRLSPDTVDDDWGTRRSRSGFHLCCTRHRRSYAQLSVAVYLPQIWRRCVLALFRYRNVAISGKLAINLENSTSPPKGNWNLVLQGFVTAIANPKGWAFMVSLPPFIDQAKP